MATYTGLRGQVSAEEEHLGGNVVEGDPFTFAPKVWDYLVNRFALTSVLDLGSGLGYAANYFHRKGLRVVAVDGLRRNVENAIYPTILADLTKGPVECRVDLVHCQEVVEHIDEAFVANVTRSLASGRFIVLTHARPDEDGHHHVNLKPAEYWIEKMAEVDCHLLQQDTDRVRGLADVDDADFLRKSGLVFANRRAF